MRTSTIFRLPVLLLCPALAFAQALPWQKTEKMEPLLRITPLGVREAWVSHYDSGVIPAFDVATALAIDRLGNVYVTGHTSSPSTGADFFTIKYDLQGAEVWKRRYDGESHGDDQACAIGIDSMGNVYVTGTSAGQNTSADFVTIKYDKTGTQQWAARYNGPGNSRDETVALAVDKFGKIYVTGNSISSSSASDYVTIKYNANGQEEWSVRYTYGDSLTDSYDQAKALAVDDFGNVYVTGSDQNYSAYATVKYNSAGSQEWVARHDEWGSDRAVAVAVDAEGNVYVTGTNNSDSPSAGYITIKYNNAGVQQWAARYDGPAGEDNAADLAIDEAGNVYVTGSSAIVRTTIDHDYATVKYNSAGVQEWVARYNGPDNNLDFAVAIVLDPAADGIDLYVTGWSLSAGTGFDFTTIQYSRTGAEKLVLRYDGPANNFDRPHAIGLDDAGNVYVTGESWLSASSSAYATIKYSRTGNTDWVVRHNNPGSSADQAKALVVASAQNGNHIGVTGWSQSLKNGRDYNTVTYDSFGKQLWAARYNGPGNADDQAVALATDGAGNIYVTGWSTGEGTAYDYATIKYDRAGVQQWVARYNGPENADDMPVAIVVDVSGNIYVTGTSGPSLSTDYATIKYNSAGKPQWVMRYNGPRNGWDEAVALAVDRNGNVYVTGKSQEMSDDSDADCATIKYDPAGAEQWIARYDGPAHNWDDASAIAVDELGNVYVTGTSLTPGSLTDFVTIKYDHAGVQQWLSRDNAPYTNSVHPVALAVDGDGNAYMTGWSDTPDRFEDYATIKYNHQGVQQWVANYKGPGRDYPTGLAIDSLGSVYVTGRSASLQDNLDYVTVKYNTHGRQQWLARYDGPRHAHDLPNAIAVDAAGNAYVTGFSFDGTSWNIEDPPWSLFTTIKYEQFPSPIFVSSRSRLDFGNVRVGAAETDTISISNWGTAALNILAAESDQPAFRIIPVSATIAPDSSAIFSITFLPASPGEAIAHLIFKHNASLSPDTVSVKGKGVTPQFTVSPREIDFGQVPLGFSERRAIRVTNFGNAILLIDSVSSDNHHFLLVSENGGQVTIVADTLQPGNTKTYFVQFTPDDTIPQQAAIVFSHNAPGSPDTVWVAGKGVDVAFFPIPAVLDFGKVSLRQVWRDSVTIFNPQNQPLAIAQVFFSDPQFAVQPNQATISPRSRASFEVSFAPTDTGTFFAALIFLHDAASSPDTVAAVGRGYPDLPVHVNNEKPSAATYALLQNYPNPFNPSTTIRYAIARPGHVTLKIFDLAGKAIATLVNETQTTGEYAIQWNPSNVPSGVYLYRLQVVDSPHGGDGGHSTGSRQGFVEMKKLVLLK